MEAKQPNSAIRKCCRAGLLAGREDYLEGANKAIRAHKF